ncbi:MAG: aconitase family protein, partial [Candidatus Desantisbacteria bacterium]
LENIIASGALADILAAGARVTEPVCGFCIGNSQSPQTNAVSVRTSNRNFFGRSGTRNAQVYLLSPESAAAAAITGKITDPRHLGIKYPQVQMPERFYIDDSMIILPSLESVEIYRGPNIGEPPHNTQTPECIEGVVTIKVGDKITTDHIIPAGSRMKYRSNVPEYSKFVFEIEDEGFAQRAAAYRDSGKHNIIVAGIGYGQGSSREHAAICPMFLGVKAVLAKSFERIHAANLINFGIIPLTFANDADYEQINPGDEVIIADVRRLLAENKPLTARINGMEIAVNCSLSDRQRQILLAGGMLGMG